MKQLSVTLFFCIAISICTQAQKTFTIEQGQNISHSIPADEVYMYPYFKQGVVYYKNKNAAGGALNYSYLTQELFFTGPGMDTLSIVDPEEIDSVIINGDKLYYQQGFVKLDTIACETKLAFTSLFSPSDKKVVGYNGIASGSTSNMTYVQYKLNPSANMVADELTILLKHQVFYIGDRMNHFMEVSKKNLYKFYSKNQIALKNYLELNTVSYTNRADIIKLICFMKKQ